MRVLLTCVPGHGHFYPLVPLGRALLGAGHEVRVATGASFCPTVERAGLAALPAGIDWSESRPERAFPDLDGLEPHILSLALGRVIGYVHPRAMVRDLRPFVARWRPDVVVAESSEWGGVLAAELEGVPYALLAIALATGGPVVGGALFPALGVTDREERKARRELFRGSQSLWALREELGLSPPPELWEDQPLNRRYLTLDTAPPSLHFYVPEAAARTAHPLRPVPVRLDGGAAAGGGWLGGLPEDRPVVHVTMGTVFFRSTHLLRAILEGLGTEAVHVVLAAGPAAADELGPLPANVLVERWVDYGELLPRCRLVVAHGGSGTMLAALYHGVPLLMVPQGADQPVNAVRIRSVGAGRFLLPREVTPEAVRREVGVLLEDPVYRLNARRLQAEIGAMPGPEEAVALLERLAAERRPLEVRSAVFPRFEAARVPLISQVRDG